MDVLITIVGVVSYILVGATTHGFFNAKKISPLGEEFIDGLLWPIALAIYFGDRIGRR